jgi:hypothetical protein
MRTWTAATLMLAALAAPHLAHAYTDTTPLLLCNGCRTQQQFNSFAATSIGTRYGTFEYLVVNPSSAVIYDVTVEATSEEGHRRVISYSTAGTGDMSQAFEFWWPYFGESNAKALAQISATPPANAGDGMSSFGASDQGEVCTAFTGSPGFVKLEVEMNKNVGRLFFRLLKQLFGYGPTGVFIFSNGDVATYRIYPDNPGVGACAYVKGSARNAQGLFINDRGLGGNGSSNGSDYVRGGNGQFTVLTQSYTIACTYVEDEGGRLAVAHCEIMMP